MLVAAAAAGMCDERMRGVWQEIGGFAAASHHPLAAVHLLSALVQAPPKEEWVLILDPDMQIRDTFSDWGRVYGAGGWWAHVQSWWVGPQHAGRGEGYLRSTCMHR